MRQIKLSQVFRGLTCAPKWVPEEADVARLLDIVPDRYRTLMWLTSALVTGMFGGAQGT